MRQLLAPWRGLKKLVLRFGGNRSSWGWGWPGYRRTTFDYASAVGDGRGNSIVVACVDWICRTFPEAPLRVRVVRGRDLEEEPLHPLIQLLRRPNPYYHGLLLWKATLADWMITGNAYWIKIRSGAGRPVQLWWIPSTMIQPKWPDDGSEFLTHYEYNSGIGEPTRVEVEDVVHFRYNIDPNNPRLGLSPLASVVRELFVDEEAANWTGALLRNVGIPGVVIEPQGETTINADGAKEIKAQFIDRFTGDNRGLPLVLSAAAKVNMISFSPEQMNLRYVRQVPEERVTAVFGLSCMLVGLGAGLEHSIYNNVSEAREAAYESNLIPTQDFLAADIQWQLVPDFGDPNTTLVDFDRSKVRVLQEDQDKLHARARDNLKAGGILVDEFRAAIGLEPLPNGQGEVLYVPTTLVPTDPSGLLEPEIEEVEPLALPEGVAPLRLAAGG